MNSCRPVTEEILTHPIHIQTNGQELDFSTAKKLAYKEAQKHSTDPMLMAWFDKKADQYSPLVDCCGEDKPSWVIYAESRGGNITIDINHEEYVFIYLGE